MDFLTKEEFFQKVNEFNENNEKVEHWTNNRWFYHEQCIEIISSRVPVAEKVLEIGPMGVQIVHGSDVMDFKVPKANWPIGNPKYVHNAKVVPWPIGDKEYDVVAALRVYQHLAPQQEQAFLEACRISKNVLIVVPLKYAVNSIGSKGITHNEFVDWGAGVQTSIYIETVHGNIFFWNEDATAEILRLRKN